MFKQLLLLIFMLSSSHLTAHVFSFKDQPGDEYFIRTYSLQELLINNEFKGTTDLKYEGRLKVLSNSKLGAKISGKYLYYSKPHLSSQPYRLENKRHTLSQFIRRSNGKMTIGSQVFFPVVRHVPTFPKRSLQIGDSWVAPGEEAQDLRKFGLSKPYIFPFKGRYRYVRDETFRGKDCAVFEVMYVLNHNNKRPFGKSSLVIPARVMGYFKGYYYWDKKEGFPVYYEGDYDFIYVLMNGTVLEFKGIEYGDVQKNSSKPVEIAKIPDNDVNKVEKDIKKKLKDKGLNFPVQKKKKKIIINIGELLFDFDSDRLKKENIQQLDKLAKLLMKYDHFRLTVDGHTDAIGSRKANRLLSAKRAKRVRDYLVQKGVSKDKITSKGYGEDQPIATNSTSEGRTRNRRVEITIDLDKEKTK